MSKSIMIDPGHGGTDTGAVAFGAYEKDWNLRISLYQYERLKELGANVGITRKTDKTLNSGPRTAMIRNKYDLCISNHFNAYNGSARGVETIHSYTNNGAFATRLANAIVNESKLPLRRVFTRRLASGANYYFMIRETGRTETVIVEYGFLDNRQDHDFYKNDANFFRVAEAVIEAVCDEIGITYKQNNYTEQPEKEKEISGTLHKVQAGAFSKRANANELQERLQENGLDSFVLKEGGLFKVQAGAYRERKNAEERLQKVQKIVSDAFIIVQGKTAPTPAPAPKPAKKSWQAVAKEIHEGKGNWGNYPARKTNLERQGYNYQQVQNEVNRLMKQATTIAPIKKGDRLRLNQSAGRYATGEAIPSSVKGRTYTAMQPERNGQVLLREIYSWVYTKDVTRL